MESYNTMTIFLRSFDDKAELLSLLMDNGLANIFGVDRTVVDLFEIWPKKFGNIQTPSGQNIQDWYDDVEQEPKWAANLALNECPERLLEFQIFPETPRRVFSE